MLDADGDGFRDVLYPHYNSFRYASGGDIKDGLFRGYADPLELKPQGTWQFDWTSSQVKVSDLFSGKEAELGRLKYSEGATGGGRQVGPFGGERGGRYIWTSKRGWIDLGHFFQVVAESKARIDSSIWPKWLAAGPARGRVRPGSPTGAFDSGLASRALRSG